MQAGMRLVEEVACDLDDSESAGVALTRGRANGRVLTPLTAVPCSCTGSRLEVAAVDCKSAFLA
jgi:hypothetical protein